MTRVKGGPSRHARHKKITRQAKGFYGRRKNIYSAARQQVQRSWQYAYRDRRQKKRNFRALWIQRINAAARQHGLTYARFMHGLRLAGIELDRKVLADLAVREEEAFGSLAEQARQALNEKS